MKIAIIGGGAAGIITAYLLDKKGYEVEVFEKTGILGGNVRTLNKNVTSKNLPSDIYLEGGVIEFSNAFSKFRALLDELKVPYENVEIGTGLFFKNRKYLLSTILAKNNLAGVGLLLEKLKLNLLYLTAFPIWLKLKKIKSNELRSLTLSEIFTRETKVAKWLKLFMMYSYSTNFNALTNFSAELAIYNIKNYMLAGWFRICGGVYSYIERILIAFGGEIHLNTEVTSIDRTSNKVLLELSNGVKTEYDKVVFAIPPQNILCIIKNPTEAETSSLKNWKPNEINTIIHSDKDLYADYPIKNPSEFDFFETAENWGYNAILNQVCGINSNKQYFLSYNLEKEINHQKIIEFVKHESPLYTQKATKSISILQAINGEHNTFFAGAWLYDGLHEGATKSAREIERLII